jgi:hypothetical protein
VNHHTPSHIYGFQKAKRDNGRVQVAAREAFNLHFIFDGGMAPNRGSPATICWVGVEWHHAT